MAWPKIGGKDSFEIAASADEPGLTEAERLDRYNAADAARIAELKLIARLHAEAPGDIEVLHLLLREQEQGNS